MKEMSILLADDDASVRLVTSQALAQAGHRVRATSAFSALLKWVEAGEGDLIISDVYMPDGEIFEFLPRIRRKRPNLPVIVISGESTVTTAASAARHGAVAYLPKPFDIDEMLSTVARALPRSAGAGTIARGHERDAALPITGRSAAMQSVFRSVARVLDNDLTVVLEGEPGVGKQRIARAIHDMGHRTGKAFIPVWAAELGGSDFDRLLSPGGTLAARAKGGTIFLQDVGELDHTNQGKLLAMLSRDLPTGGPPGSQAYRLIVGSNLPVAGLVVERQFRPELAILLGAVKIAVPPLRNRMEDIIDLVQAFCAAAAGQGLPEKPFDKKALEALKSHTWPGNVAELERSVQTLLLNSTGQSVTHTDVDALFAAHDPVRTPDGSSFEADVETLIRKYYSAEVRRKDEAEGDLHAVVTEAVEAALIRLALEATGGNKVRAAAIIGLNRNTLRSRIEQLGLAKEE